MIRGCEKGESKNYVEHSLKIDFTETTTRTLRPELQLERYDQNCPLVAAVSAVRLLTFGKLWQSLHLEFTC